jgi:hypothetical protein
MARLLHTHIKAPAALCGQSVLAAAALAVQGHADILLDSRVFPLSEYFLAIAESGERKSAVDRLALGPHYHYQRSLWDDHQAHLRSYEDELDVYKRGRAMILRSKQNPVDQRHALQDLVVPIRPKSPILVIEEPTYEGLIKLLQVGRPSVGVFTDEGGRLLGGHAMNRENQLKTAAGLSELWDGKPISRVRVADGATLLYGRRVSAHIMVQPAVANVLLGNVLLQGQGLLSRMLVTFPDSWARACMSQPP